MSLLKRFGYYFIGLTLGGIIVFFFWKNNNISFDYLPNARTLKNIRVKKRIFSNEAKKTIQTYQIDTAQISTILKTGIVDFGKSKPHQKPCREYWVDSEGIKKQISLIVKNCDSIVTIEKIKVKNLVK